MQTLIISVSMECVNIFISPRLTFLDVTYQETLIRSVGEKGEVL